MPLLKMAEHSLRARIAENKHGVNIERSSYLLNTRTISALFLFNAVNAGRNVRSGDDEMNPSLVFN